MRRIAGTFVTLLATAGLASTALGQAQNPPPRRQGPAQGPAAAKAAGPMNAPAPNPAAMKKLLKQWEVQSARLNSLSVGFTRIDTSHWGDEEYQGRAYLKKTPAEGQKSHLACLHFQEVTRGADKQPQVADHERIVVTGTEVRDYDYKTKQIFVYPLARQDRKRALQEGPLPFLFNMNAGAAEARYTMSLLKENADAYLIEVIPLVDQDKEVFSQALLLLSKKTFLPDRLVLVSPNGKDKQDYRFKDVVANEEINPKFFEALMIKGWKEIYNPAPEPVGRAQPQPGRAAPGPMPPNRPQVGAKPGNAPPRNQ
jgi:TIGR03009 family protein